MRGASLCSTPYLHVRFNYAYPLKPNPLYAHLHDHHWSAASFITSSIVACYVLTQTTDSDFGMSLSLSIIDAAGPISSHLCQILDWDNDYERDLIAIADHMIHWEEKLRHHLELTNGNVHNIKEKYDKKPVLQRYVTLFCMLGM
jgi:hypothetical protein